MRLKLLLSLPALRTVVTVIEYQRYGFRNDLGAPRLSASEKTPKPGVDHSHQHARGVARAGADAGRRFEEGRGSVRGGWRG